MIENSSLSKNAKRLTVRVKSLQTEEQGSGIIYFSQKNTERLYIITAKHCICGEDFSVVSPKSEDIEIGRCIKSNAVRNKSDNKDKYITL